jgi:hypothetical protein
LVSTNKISSPYLIGWESTERFGLEEKNPKIPLIFFIENLFYFWIIKADRSVGPIDVVPVAVTSVAPSSPEKCGIPVAKQQLNCDFSPVLWAACVHVLTRIICCPKWSKPSLADTLNGI